MTIKGLKQRVSMHIKRKEKEEEEESSISIIDSKSTIRESVSGREVYG